MDNLPRLVIYQQYGIGSQLPLYATNIDKNDGPYFYVVTRMKPILIRRPVHWDYQYHINGRGSKYTPTRIGENI